MVFILKCLILSLRLNITLTNIIVSKNDKIFYKIYLK